MVWGATCHDVAHPFAPGASADPNLVAAITKLTITMLAFQPRVTSPVSASHLAHSKLETLRLIPGGISTVVGDGEPVLTAVLQNQLRLISTSEHEVGVIKFLTPFLTKLRLPADGGEADPCPPVLVNSEHLQWLVHPSVESRRDLRLKPDLFRSWAPFVEFRNGNEKQGSGNGYDFGLLADYALQRAGCASELYEAKVNLTEGAFGELCGYHECVPGVCFGMLFNATDFWLYKSNAGIPIRLLKGQWTARGSADSIRDFLTCSEPPLVNLLRRLLRCLHVVPVRFDGRSHLGSGGYGHVFAVGDSAAPQAPPQALKVVLTSDHAHVAVEFERLEDAARAGAPVVPPVKGSMCWFSDGEQPSGGGYLLARVGVRFAVTTKQRCCAAFDALAALHKLGIIHGDPRLPNLLLVDGSACWVDLFSSASRVAPDSLRYDAAVLVRSVLSLASEDALPTGVERVLRRYSAAETESVTALAAEVWAARE